jgi:hypothetical protein
MGSEVLPIGTSSHNIHVLHRIFLPESHHLMKLISHHANVACLYGGAHEDCRLIQSERLYSSGADDP